MSIAVHVDQPVGGRSRRALAYGGAVNVTSPSPASLALATFARELVGDAFGGRDPELAQFDLPVAEHDAVVDALTRRFTQHPESTRLLGDLLLERGADPETTYVGVPHLRVHTGNVAGVDAWRPHRDTWRCAPLAQLNHWMPVYEVDEDNAVALHTGYFSQAIGNDSAGYDHRPWTRAVGATPSPPVATETVDPFSAAVFVTPVGGVLQFSGQHLYCTAPRENDRTRFVIDVPTVDAGDVRAGLGARNVDGRCLGSSIRDFIRVADLSPMPEDVVAVLEHRGAVASAPPARPAFTKA
ncbi:hypothetical protein CIW49_22395 [Mycolicibacterium sp. P1-18]|uniref:hypothetical protein n=1 Tax=Mycolicibacterium sp. P1-18 TaxID=2024615 RepID=UPI0011F0E0BB|nr:hypothetical protein [Mycolicibacterium sp. P1-18]KAA0095237.1 hypothetical protein CIW49_22395 [Mycolicibacterium sp. P1-18]